MLLHGIDYAWSHPSPAAIKAARFGFVARYLSHDTSKALSSAEARALHAEGILIVVVWEDTAQAALRGQVGGRADATEANRQAVACGLAGIPIYFAADWDATPAQQAAINAYLDGAASVIGRPRTGLYGGYWPLSRARTAGKTSRFWGTPAWSGTNWQTCGWQPHIMQGATVSVGGVSVDLDTSLAADFGQWPRPAAPAPVNAPTKPQPAPAPKPAPSEEDDMPAGIIEASVNVRESRTWPAGTVKQIVLWSDWEGLQTSAPIVDLRVGHTGSTTWDAGSVAFVGNTATYTIANPADCNGCSFTRHDSGPATVAWHTN
jgi:hypothetical protein